MKKYSVYKSDMQNALELYLTDDQVAAYRANGFTVTEIG